LQAAEAKSLSDPANNFIAGRIIYGLQPANQGHFARPETAFWNDETEARYMEQVRERAQRKASEILAQAMMEAELIRKQAQQEGFEAGRQEFHGLAKAEQTKATLFLSKLQKELIAEKQRLATAHKHSLFAILNLAFEKTLGTVLADKQAEVLGTLFDEAVEQLQASTTMTLYVGPQDAELAKTLLATVRSDHPELPDITLKIAPDLSGGGLRLESGDGLVDNSITSRFEQVRSILENYSEDS